MTPGPSRRGGWFIHSGAIRAALPAGDFRDWPKIEAWAHEIAAELKAASVTIPA